jgi:hypothetical protein
MRAILAEKWRKKDAPVCKSPFIQDPGLRGFSANKKPLRYGGVSGTDYLTPAY